MFHGHTHLFHLGKTAALDHLVNIVFQMGPKVDKKKKAAAAAAPKKAPAKRPARPSKTVEKKIGGEKNGGTRKVRVSRLVRTLIYRLNELSETCVLNRYGTIDGSILL